MKTIKINRYRVTKRTLAKAVEVLRAGGVVVHPSESSYGLAVDPRQPEAVKHIFRLKKRSSGKPVLLAAASATQAEKTVKLTGQIKKLATKHWPGPLTIIAPAVSKLDLTGTGKPTPQIAVRVPVAAWLRALAKELGYPVTSTSVNLSGKPPAYSACQVRDVFKGQKHQPDLFLNAGRLPSRPPSTIVKQHGKQIRVIRSGSAKL